MSSAHASTATSQTTPLPPPEPCDVLVIGGGPAGSTIATLLTEYGRHVVLLEKDTHPRFHIGESLLPQNLPLFERLGLLDEIRKIGVYKPGAEFVSDEHGKSVVFEFAKGLDKKLTYSFHVRRSEFDALLLENSRRKGAHVYEGMRATDVALDSERRSLVAASGKDGAARRWAARFVVDASGRDTVLASQFKMKETNKRNSTAALFGHFKNIGPRPGTHEGNITIHLFKHGWCWMIPLPGGVTSVGIVSNPAFFKTRKGDLTTFFMEAIQNSPSAAERMRDAQLISPITATGNYSYSARSMLGSGYILVGDAFAFVDPIFSSGVMLAMTSAALGADTVHAYLTDKASAKPYARVFDRRVRHAINSLSWLIYRINDPVLRDMFMEPRNNFRMREGLVSMLAGSVHSGSLTRMPVMAFKAAYYFLSIANRMGLRLGPQGLARALPDPAR